MKKVHEYPETHMQGRISLENIPQVLWGGAGLTMQGDLGIQIAEDGRVWVCIDGVAFLRFSPHPNGRMNKLPEVSTRTGVIEGEGVLYEVLVGMEVVWNEMVRFGRDKAHRAGGPAFRKASEEQEIQKGRRIGDGR